MDQSNRGVAQVAPSRQLPSQNQEICSTLAEVGTEERETACPAAGERSRAGPRFWVLVTATLSPLVLIGGWVLAGRLQDDGFSPLQQSVSFLASYGPQDRSVMTVSLVIVGCLNIATASGLTGVRPLARIVLAAAGACTVVVAACPQPVSGSSIPHLAAAAGGAGLLTLWVVLAGDPARPGPYPLTIRGALISAMLITVVVLALLAAAQLDIYLGLCERICTGIQTSWPLVIAGTLRHHTVLVVAE